MIKESLPVKPMEEKIRKILITGATGFAGSHLVDKYLDDYDNVEVYGLYRRRSPLDHIKHRIGNERFHLIKGDITEYDTMFELFSTIDFDVVHHLAAQSFVPDSWTMGNVTFDVNVNGTFNILNAIVNANEKTNLYPVIHIAGSSEEYGLVYQDELPIKESNPLRPLSPYAVSKIATEYLGYQMSKSYGLKVFVTRAFNHTGPRRGVEFVCSSFAKQIVDIVRKKHDKVHSKDVYIINVGDLSTIRDFTDVRDMVSAYISAANYLLCQPDVQYFKVANVATGVGHTIKDVLYSLIDIASLTNDVTVKQDPARMRPSDVPVLIGDSHKFRSLTSWEPKIPFEQTLTDLFDYWMNR